MLFSVPNIVDIKCWSKNWDEDALVLHSTTDELGPLYKNVLIIDHKEGTSTAVLAKLVHTSIFLQSLAFSLIAQ